MPVLTPPEPYISDPTLLLALCIWREARGESIDTKRGVGWVVMNRCHMAPAQGFKRSIPENVLHPWAFSSFMEGDLNSLKYPADTDASWHDSRTAAESLGLVDPTNDAVFYFSRPLIAPPHAWGNVEHAATIGGLKFYRIPHPNA